jgi:dolichyl-phosphate beta-glucosyltransferase
MNMSDKVLLIVPCFNESARLTTDKFLDCPKNIDILFADDGSTDNTGAVLEKIKNQRQGFSVFRANVNSGKANVIHLAYLHAVQTLNVSQYQWVGFWDADLATPLSEVNRFLIYQNSFSPKSGALFGCRLSRYGARINRSLFRHYLSRIFITMTDLLLGIKAYDSQCGAKLFKPKVAEVAFTKPFVSKWIFDLEIILRVGKENILEIPLFEWKEVAGSKIKIFRETFRIMSDLFRIKKTYLEQTK